MNNRGINTNVFTPQYAIKCIHTNVYFLCIKTKVLKGITKV